MWINTKVVIDIETGKILEREGFEYEGPLELCDRSIQGQAKTNAANANTTGSQFGSTANQVGSVLIPGLERQATNPTGFTPIQKNRMLVAGAESAGGAASGAGGEAALEKLRGRNPAGFSAALDEVARQKGRQMSSNALGVENADAQLAQQKQQEAMRQLQGIYGTDTSNQLKAMGLSDEDLKTALEAGKSGWLQQAQGVLGTIGNLGSQAAGAFTGLR